MAVDIEDGFNYDEPPAWFVPAKQSLGFALLRQKQYSEAEEAFKQVLSKMQRNGRLTLGIKDWEMTNVLKHASELLKLEEL